MKRKYRSHYSKISRRSARRNRDVSLINDAETLFAELHVRVVCVSLLLADPG